MKNTIQKSVDVLDNLITKYIVIKNKINENVLDQQNYQQLKNKLNNLEKMFSDDNSGSDIPSDTPSDKTYVYTVSGAGTDLVNGDYVLTEEILDGNPVYSNGNCSLNFSEGAQVWRFTGDGMIYYLSDTTDIYGSWSTFDGTDPAPTVTNYSADSGDSGNVGGGDSGDSGDSSDEVYCYTVSGAGLSGVNGNYYKTDEVFEDDVVYAKDDMYILRFNTKAGVWELLQTNGLDNYISDTSDIYGSWSTSAGGIEPAPTVTEYSTDSSDKVYYYTVSGCSNDDVNGDYYLTDQTYNDKPVYSNGKVYLFTHYMSAVGCDYVCFGTTLEFDGLFYIAASTIPIGNEIWTSTSDYREYPITIAEYSANSGDSETIPDGAVMKLTGFPVDEVNGYYSVFGEGIYSNGTCFVKKEVDYFGSPDMFWTISGASGWLYQAQTGGMTTDNPWDCDAKYWVDLSTLGDVPNAVVEQVGGSETIPEGAVLKASGFPIEEVNGYYWQTNTETGAYAPIYTNGEYAIYFYAYPGWVIAKGTGDNTESNHTYLSNTACEYPYEAEAWGDMDVMNPSDTSKAKVEKL